jgi:hypothetical protein
MLVGFADSDSAFLLLKYFLQRSTSRLHGPDTIVSAGNLTHSFLAQADTCSQSQPFAEIDQPRVVDYNYIDADEYTLELLRALMQQGCNNLLLKEFCTGIVGPCTQRERTGVG